MKHLKKILYTAYLLAAAACSKENGGDTPVTGDLARPEVTIQVNTSSLTASWEAVKGAEGYRCEVTYISSGRNVDVLKTNITETEFTVESLRPLTTYTIRVAATKDGKASPNWFMTEVKTEPFDATVTFDITPYEIYNKTTGHIDYMAKVKPSDDNVYYWIAAVTYTYKVDAKAWMEEEIADAVAAGETWETLVNAGYIVKGDAESVFAFTGEDVYMFTVGILEHIGDKINVVSNVTLSYPFHAENAENKISHQCGYKDYLGEWVVKPYDRSDYNNNEWSLDDAEPFTIKISAKEEGKSYEMTGWGGSKNKFASTPVVLNYEEANADRYEHFNIMIPQDITTENGVKWAYTGWLSLTEVDAAGNETVRDYAPYDYEYDKMAESLGGWRQAFRGIMSNANKTIIKILPNTYVADTFKIYMQSLWVCGMDENGKYDFNNTKYSLNGDRGGIPNAAYYLVRKDVADGAELPAPDVTSELNDLP